MTKVSQAKPNDFTKFTRFWSYDLKDLQKRIQELLDDLKVRHIVHVPLVLPTSGDALQIPYQDSGIIIRGWKDRGKLCFDVGLKVIYK